MKKGLLLVNLGTPSEPTPEKVGVYLKQFLMDPQVVDIPWFLRWFFVYVLIVPKRAHKSAEAYQKVWTKRGSPLLFHTSDLTNAVREKVQGFEKVDFAMRYGEPSLESKLIEFQKTGIEEVTVVPLYPQYALSSTQSTKDEIDRVAKKQNLSFRLKWIDDFYDDEGFTQAYAQKIRESVDLSKVDQLVMSFHGLPVRHLTKLGETKTHCYQDPNCCEQITSVNRFCYRAQSFHTAKKIAQALGLSDSQYKVTFQSRLGRTEWIKPYTDIYLDELAQGSTKNIAVVCPSFVADCLETLEEIGIRAKQDFESKNKGTLYFIPCLNVDEKWISSLVSLIMENEKSGILI
ncbi:MAG: ferrochelatase [Bdellovibrionales bacterium]